MHRLKILPVVLLSTLALAACDSDNNDNVVAGPLAEGIQTTMRNTLEEAGPEGSFPSQFGQPDDAYDENAVLSFSASEFPTALMQTGTPVGDIPGLYDIDLAADQISFTLLPDSDDPFWSGLADVFGIFPQGKFDRYYLTFSEAHNITGSSSNNSAVSLRIDSPTVAVVEIGAGYELSAGVSWTIDLE